VTADGTAAAPSGAGRAPAPNPVKASSPRLGRYAGLVGVLVLLLAGIDFIFIHPHDLSPIPPGQQLAPFAVPLALGNLQGDADIAKHADEGSAGKVPACAERGAPILNVCQLYEQGPVVLALFVDADSCAAILTQMQALVPEFPGVRFAAVAIKGERAQLRRLVRSHGLTLPVGIDGEGGAVADIYRVFSCPQVDFAYPGGVVQSKALLVDPSLASLRERVSELVAASRARGWRGPAA
jgi:hypothetical protein